MTICDAKEIHYRASNGFTYNITELIVDFYGNEVRKVVWCRGSLNNIILESRHNPMFHADYTPSDIGFDNAIKTVMSAFDKYWVK